LRIHRASLAAGLVIAWCAGVGAQSERPPGAGQSKPVFHSGVELVALKVTVTDRAQNYIEGLDRDDFAVYEDGVQQKVELFAAGTVPVDVAILLDMSASMSPNLEQIRTAATALVHSLGANDRASVTGFNDRVEVLQELTADQAAIESAIARITSSGATSLHNAIYITLRELQKISRSGEIRRQAIVVLSDGDDTSSSIGFENVIETVRRSGVSIYTISLGCDRALDSDRRHFSESDYEMRMLAQQSGAQAFFPGAIEELAPVYDRIAAELRHQYTIGFVPSNPRNDGALRRIVVRVPGRPGAMPRTRMNYYAPSSRATLDPADDFR
jgi:Ca-activated chloride channel family protein